MVYPGAMKKLQEYSTHIDEHNINTERSDVPPLAISSNFEAPNITIYVDRKKTSIRSSDIELSQGFTRDIPPFNAR